MRHPQRCGHGGDRNTHPATGGCAEDADSNGFIIFFCIFSTTTSTVTDAQHQLQLSSWHSNL
eukprot:6306611-Amphidinium_carterae.1